MKTKIVPFCILIFIFAFILAAYSHIRYFFMTELRPYPIQELSCNSTYSDFSESYPCRVINFKSGKSNLIGYIFGEGIKNPKGLIIFQGDKSSYSDKYLSIYYALVDSGYRVFSFDGTGTGKSDGKNQESYEQCVTDMESALKFITVYRDFSTLKIILFGHAAGAYSACCNCDFSEVKGVIAAFGFDTPEKKMQEELKKQDKLFFYLESFILKLYSKISLRNNFSAVSSISKNEEKPFLIIQGEENLESSMYSGLNSIDNRNCKFEYSSKTTFENFFYSYDAVSYREKLPKSVASEKTMYLLVDKERWNKTNPSSMEKIINFIETALGTNITKVD